MFTKSSRFVALLCLFLVSGLAACGAPEEVGETRAALTSDKKLPSWMRHIPKDWGCDQTLKGKFKGFDSAHIYSFPGKLGYKYTFSFNGKYAWYKGAAIVVYDNKTLERVAYKRQRWSNKVSIDYTAKKSVKYLVAVFSIWNYVTARYTLKSECKRTQYCVEFEGADASGNSSHTFYAKNVKSYEEGKKLLAQFKYFTNETIREGTCAQQGQMCPLHYNPVCGQGASPDKVTYGNVCQFKVNIRQQAGATGQYKGRWTVGACSAAGKFCGGIAGIQCPTGYQCILQGNYPDAGGSCSKITCDPKQEPNRSYTSTSKEQCKLIRFTCPKNTKHFSNDCGCGCEQDATCPATRNCKSSGVPISGCENILTTCPFTKIIR